MTFAPRQALQPNIFDCTLVVAAVYDHRFAERAVEIIQKHCGTGQFKRVIVSAADEPTEEFKEVKASGEKLVLVLQSTAGGAAVRFFCDDFDKPPAQRRVMWIHSISVGLDSYRLFDIPQILEGIPISNGKRSQSRTLAEYCFTAFGYFDRETWRWQKNKEEHKWEKYNIHSLYGKKLAIMGYGDIGETASQIAAAYGMEVEAVKRSLPPDRTQSPYTDTFGAKVFTEFGHDGAQTEEGKRTFEAERERIIVEADYLINCLPCTEETMLFFNKDVFAKMKNTAIYLNIGRGGTNKEADIVDALKNNQIRGAALDVFESEPLVADSPLWDVPDDKLLLTAHTGGMVAEQLLGLIIRFISLVEKWNRGEDMENESVNRTYWY